MLDRYDDFFLGKNVNESVAIEITVTVNNVYDLQRFLENIGFQITTNGYEKDKILIDTQEDNFGTYSIITPALKPEERKPFWDALKHALELYHFEKDRSTRTYYPHIIDLQNLVLKRNNISTKDESKAGQINALLKELENSKDVVVLDVKAGLPGLQLKDKGVFKEGDLINGSTLPDPYSVATGTNGRFVRFASTEIGYAFGYSNVHGSKDINGYENLSPDMKNRVGFVFKYKNQPNQMFFSNAGIENGNGTPIRAVDPETVVTRFDNPCIGIYLVWQSVRPDAKNTYVYELKENDPRYQLLKEYYTPSNSRLHDKKNERFEAWNEEQGEHKTYMPVKEGGLEQIKVNVDSFTQKRQAEEEKLKTLDTNIKNILNSVNIIPYQFRLSVPDYNDIIDIVRNDELLVKTEQEYKNSIDELNNIKQQLLSIKNDIASIDKFKAQYTTSIQNAESLLQNKMQYCTNDIGKINEYKEENKRYIKKWVRDFVSGKKRLNPRQYIDLPEDTRIDILNGLLEEAPNLSIKYDMNILPENLVNLYVHAPVDNKPELFDLLYKIRHKASKDFRKAVQKQIPNIGMFEEDKTVLTELFKSDNIFVKHTEKAKKLIALKMGIIKAQRLNQQKSVSEHDITIDR